MGFEVLKYGCCGAEAPTWLDDVRKIAPGQSTKNLTGVPPTGEEMQR